METKCEHKNTKYLETVKREVFNGEGNKDDDVFFAIRQCVDCGKIIKEEILTINY